MSTIRPRPIRRAMLAPSMTLPPTVNRAETNACQRRNNDAAGRDIPLPGRADYRGGLVTAEYRAIGPGLTRAVRLPDAPAGNGIVIAVRRQLGSGRVR